MEHDDYSVRDLVDAAAAGDVRAWEIMVIRYTPLLMSITSRFHFAEADTADVAQTVWLKLVQHLRELREPEALPGWISTTTRNECLRVVQSAARTKPYDQSGDSVPRQYLDTRTSAVEIDAQLLHNERHEALLTAFAELTERQRELVLLLIEDPPPDYREISVRLDMPLGAIGPTRARALERLRRHPAIAALLPDADLRGDVAHEARR